jgi:hypothetical protein
MIEISPDLLSFLKEEYDRCQDETLEDERTTAIDRYNGMPYGDEEDGRSQVVSRDTAETTDYMVISIMRTIVSGDDVVEFSHKNADLAHQATQTIKWLLMKKQDGYQAIHDWLKAGLLEKNAVAMTYGEPQPPRRKRVEGVSALALAAAEQQGIKVIEAEPAGEEGEEGPVYTVVISEERGPKFCDDAVPNEEFYCSVDAKTITLAPMKGRKRSRPIHELVAEGIPRDELEGLGNDAYCDGSLARSRDGTRERDFGDRSGTARTVWWHEEYVTFDENGDGIAELLYIRRTGDFKIFSIEEMDDEEDHPFEDWCPFPMQHRRIGQSLADKVMDIERISTVLTRQSLDGIYLSNSPSTYVNEASIGDNTVEDLLNVRPGRLIRWRGAIPPQERQGNFDPGAGFNMLEYMERKRETRTGITRLNQGLDDRTLNDTARGQEQLQERGDQVEEYVARNFANALAKLFTKKAKLLKRHGEPIEVPIDGEYVEVDPRQWPDDMIAEPRLGLGATRKEKRLLHRRELIGYQSAALQAGLSIVDDQKFYNSAKGFVNDAGLGDVTEFFNDPSKPQIDPATGQPVQKQERPDPEMAKVQAQVEMKKLELGMKQQEAAAKLSLQQAEAQARLEAMQQQGMAKAQIDAQKVIFDNQMAQARAQFEAQLAERQMQVEAALEMQKIQAQERSQARAAAFSASVGRNRKGGDLSK